MKRTIAALLAVIGLITLVAACGTGPRTVTYRFTFEVNAHDETSLGYSHLFDTVGVTVDPTGYITNMTSDLHATGYGLESAAAKLDPEGTGSTFAGPTGPNIRGWTSYEHSDSKWAIVENYGLWSWTIGHCDLRVNFAVQSGGGAVESYAYPLWTWSGSCTNNQYLSTAS